MMSYRFLKTVDIKHIKNSNLIPFWLLLPPPTPHQLSHSRDCEDHHAHPLEVACPRDGAVRPSPGPSLCQAPFWVDTWATPHSYPLPRGA